MGGSRGEPRSRAVGNVWSFAGRRSLEHIARPNPLVEPGDDRLRLCLGASTSTGSGRCRRSCRPQVEHAFDTPDGTSTFTQLTLDGTIEFPTFRSQRLRIDAHAVATRGRLRRRARATPIWAGRHAARCSNCSSRAATSCSSSTAGTRFPVPCIVRAASRLADAHSASSHGRGGRAARCRSSSRSRRRGRISMLASR